MSTITPPTGTPFVGDNHEALVSNSAGFGQGVSGGFGGQVLRVTSLEDSGPGTLRDCATKGNSWVVFDVSGEIRLQSGVKIANNTTIDGRGAAITITGHGLSTASRENIIVHNLKIGDVNGDGITVFKSKNIWINHVSVSNTTDGAIDITDQSKNVTVSWCHFENQNKTMLIGNNNTKTGDVVMSVTLHHNFYDSTIRRNPFARFGAVHMYNNVLFDWGDGANSGDCVNATYGARVLLENNVFEAGPNKRAVRDSIPKWSVVPGYIKARGNLALNAADVFSSQPDKVFEAGDFYGYRLDGADDDLAQLVKAYAGWQPASFFEGSVFAAEAGARGPDGSVPGPGPVPGPVPGPDPIPTPDPDPEPDPTPVPDDPYRFEVGDGGKETIKPEQKVWPIVTLVGFDQGDVISNTKVKSKSSVIMDLRKLNGPRLTFKGKNADQAWIDHVVYL